MSWFADSGAFRRDCAAGGLVAGAVMSAAWVLLQPAFPSGYEARLAAIDAGGAGAATSAALFTASQLPMLAAVLGIAHLLRRDAPVLSNLGGALSVVGTFGHAVFGGISLVTVVMAQDLAQRSEYAGLWEDIETSPVMVFSALGLLGTVLGLLLLSIGLWRAQVAPRWVPVTLWLFLVVEFVGTGLSDYAGYLSGLLLIVAFVALAREVRAGWAVADAPLRLAV